MSAKIIDFRPHLEEKMRKKIMGEFEQRVREGAFEFEQRSKHYFAFVADPFDVFEPDGETLKAVPLKKADNIKDWHNLANKARTEDLKRLILEMCPCGCGER